MSYDADDAPPQSGNAPPRRISTAYGRDLATITTLLELAVIELTPDEKATFTREELFAMARDIGGSEVTLLDTDLDNVVRNSGYLVVKLPGDRYRMA